MRKVVITKALDIIGYSLCNRLLNEGVEVEAFDRLKGNQQKENKLDFVARNALFHFHDGEPEDKQFHGVFSETDVFYYFPNESTGQNLHNAINETIEKLRTLVKIIHPSTFIVLSSSTDVYRPVSGSIDESGEILPVSVKGMLSYINESICIQSSYRNAILRFSEIYASTHSPHDGHHQSTGAIHIEEAVEALFNVANLKETGIYNIAVDNSDSAQGFRNSKPDSATDRSDVQEPPSCFCIDKAKKRLGFSPQKTTQDKCGQQKAPEETE